MYVYLRVFSHPYWPFLTPRICTVQAIKTLISDQVPVHVSLATTSPVLVLECQSTYQACLAEVHEAVGMEHMAVGKWVVDPGCREMGTVEERGMVAGWVLLGRDGFRPLEAARFGAAGVLAAVNRKHMCVYYGVQEVLNSLGL